MVLTKIKTTTSCGCSSSNNSKTACPSCSNSGLIVKGITIKSQLKKEFLDSLKASIDDFNFCTNPKCESVYYSNDGSEMYKQEAIKVKVTIKNDDPKTPLCYCRKLYKSDVMEMIDESREDVVKKVKAVLAKGKSFCEKSNPKGVCCTEDIKSFLKGFDIDWDKPQKGFSLTPPSSGCC